GIRSGCKRTGKCTWKTIGIIVGSETNERPRRTPGGQAGICQLAHRRELVRLNHPIRKPREILKEEGVEVVSLRAWRVAGQNVVECECLQIRESTLNPPTCVLAHVP